MRRFFKSITDLSLFQQLGVIIVTFGVGIVFFFTIYMRGNIDDFVTSQIMAILQRTQSNVIVSVESNNDFSDNVYSAEITHFVYKNNKLVTIYGSKVFEVEFFNALNEVVGNHTEGISEGLMESGVSYYYYMTAVNRDVTVISIVEKSYGNAIEAQLLSNVSNNTAMVFSIIFILLMFWVSAIIAPLLQMQGYIEKIKKGDDKAVLNIDRKDEIGELANALVNMRDEIRAQEEAKEEMIHNISHDLKTPIATIKSYAESIKDGIYPYDTLEKSVDVIIENADRLEKKVYSLLFLNRLDYMMEQEKNTDKTTEMHMLIDSVLLSLKMIKPDIKIMRNLRPATFKGDAESWRVVVSNLLDNALRYAKTNVLITLDETSLTVSNDGEGISQERMDKLFKPFEKGTKGNFGLGLSICYKVCNTYGYNIVAENLEDGVIFRITQKEVTKRRVLNLKRPEIKKQTTDNE